MAELLTIAQASLETGIAKEVLRKWEVRYGFPIPIRNELGKRVYPVEQLARLKLVKKLLDAGHRPAQVVPMREPALSDLLSSTHAEKQPSEDPNSGPNVVAWLKERDPALLRRALADQLASQGLLQFARDYMPNMNKQVGQAWQDGEIAIRDEHIYSEIVQGLVREALAQRVQAEGTPRILLTTAPGEPHALGLLMLEAVLCMENAYCISLGPQSPVEEIVAAACEHRIDIVALSFSIAFPRKKIPAILRALRLQLPAHIKLWAGGSGTHGIEPKPRGITFLATLAEAIASLHGHRIQSSRQAVYSGT